MSRISVSHADKRTPPFHVEYFSSLEEILILQEKWEVLQKEGTSSPYQQFLWSLGWYTTVSRSFNETPFVIAVKNNHDDIVGLFPFVLRKIGGCTVCGFIGKNHNNYNMGLFAKNSIALLNTSLLKTILQRVADQMQIDCYTLANQPSSWESFANPLVRLAGQPSPSPSYSAILPSSAQAFYEQQLKNRQSRRRMRNKERQLMESAGYRFVQAQTKDEKHGLLDAFFAHKQDWATSRSYHNPFASAAVQNFFKYLAAQPHSGLELYALQSEDSIIAVFCAMVQEQHMAGLFTSIDTRNPLCRFSPGELLIFHLMQACSNRGLRSFDLGIGEAGYKESFCPIEETLHDAALPCSPKGKVYARLWLLKQRVKSRIKRHPTLFKWAQRTRDRLKACIGG